jgi:PhnB protein
MQHVFIYLLFNGACAEAMHFYEHVFGGHIDSLTSVGESPMAAQFPPGAAHRVIHARLTFGGNTIMASDWMAPEPYPGIHGMRVMLTYDDAQKAASVFAALSEQGKVESPLQKTPFARAYGTLRDRFGTPWQVMVE